MYTKLEMDDPILTKNIFNKDNERKNETSLLVETT